MKFLLVVSLAAVAIVLASRSKKVKEYSNSEEEDLDDEAEIGEYETEEEPEEDWVSPAGDVQYSEPSVLNDPERSRKDEIERPEYDSDNVPIMEVDAETEKRESLMSNSNKIM